MNVVAASAWAEVDVRVARAADAGKLDRMFRGLKCADKKCSLKITGGLNRPPMERGPGTVALYKKARGIAAELGFELAEAATGGGSDGNFTAALGVPTLDGLGAVGEGAHAAHEHVMVAEHLAPRTALLAGLIASGSRAKDLRVGRSLASGAETRPVTPPRYNRQVAKGTGSVRIGSWRPARPCTAHIHHKSQGFKVLCRFPQRRCARA